MKPQVVIGMVGSALDQGDAPDRWERWRPTVDLFRHDDFLVRRFELLHLARDGRWQRPSPRTSGRCRPRPRCARLPLDVADPWDFEQVYGALHDFARAYAFTPDREDYLVHMTTGTHVVQICLFLLTESRHICPRASSRPRRRAGAAAWAV